MGEDIRDGTDGGSVTTVEQTRTTRTEPAEIIPFGGWERTPASPGPDDREVLFRFPAPDDPAPGTLRLVTMSLYAAVLGLLAVGMGLRTLAVTFFQGAPGWHVPVLAVPALASVALAVGSFLSIHRPTLPWLLLAGATVPLVGEILVVMIA
jgi:hypothetical protein